MWFVILYVFLCDNHLQSYFVYFFTRVCNKVSISWPKWVASTACLKYKRNDKHWFDRTFLIPFFVLRLHLFHFCLLSSRVRNCSRCRSTNSVTYSTSTCTCTLPASTVLTTVTVNFVLFIAISSYFKIYGIVVFDRRFLNTFLIRCRFLLFIKFLLLHFIIEKFYLNVFYRFVIFISL